MLALALVYATLCPIDLRPHSGFSAGLERFCALALTGALFGFAYHHSLRTIFFLTLSIGALEFAQNFTLTRHGHFLDFATKAFGAAMGVVVAIGLNRLLLEARSQQLETLGARLAASRRDDS